MNYSQFTTVKAVVPDSPASKTIIAAGDVLLKINGCAVSDVLDYRFLSYDGHLLLELAGVNGKKKLVRIKKPEGAELGLEFGTFLMDKERRCANRCIFCFIDQMPPGMRETLYYKDDDVRLSFFQGNYVTLTNLSQSDVERIAKLRVSPINVSIHTLDPELRARMMGIKSGDAGVGAFKALVKSSIAVNCQIVCCPGINDGAELSRTMKGLARLGEGVKSVSIVPVGLTKHREGLSPLRPFDEKLALATVRQVERFGEICARERGSRVFFCADELYIAAGLRLPPHGFYEDYPQLENGVGMMRLFMTEFVETLRINAECRMQNAEFIRNPDYGIHGEVGFSIVTGTAASKYLTILLNMFTKIYDADRIRGRVYAVRNEFFGDSVTVSGLVTGRDIIAQLKGRDLGSTLFLPQNMLRDGDDVFLDDVTLSGLSEALGVRVRAVRQDGAELLRAMLEAVEN